MVKKSQIAFTLGTGREWRIVSRGSGVKETYFRKIIRKRDEKRDAIGEPVKPSSSNPCSRILAHKTMQPTEEPRGEKERANKAFI